MPMRDGLQGDQGRGYVEFASWAGVVSYRSGAPERLRLADALIFDFDGTLVDVRGSFVRAAVEAARLLVARRAGYASTPSRASLMDIIPRLKETGLLNNEWDTAYALVLASLLSAAKGIDVAAAADAVASCRTMKELYDIRDAVQAPELSDYPGAPPRSMLPSLFDSMYFGRKMYLEVYSSTPPLPLEPGFFSFESAVVEGRTFELLRAGRRRLGLLTGRPRRAFVGVARDLLEGQFGAGSAFLAESIGSSKPDPSLLREAVKQLGSSKPVYVGDSAEDLMLAAAAGDVCCDVLFVGVYGHSVDPRRAMAWFTDNRADIVVPSLDVLPLML